MRHRLIHDHDERSVLIGGGESAALDDRHVQNLQELRRRRGEPRPQAERVFAAVFASGLIGIGWYTAVKSAYISTVFSTLVEEQRSVLLLVMLEGMSYREVADIQGVPIGTVMSRLARARAHVKASLEGERTALRRVK